MSLLTFDTGWKERQSKLTEKQLPRLDGGYYDTLVAVGYAALVDSYCGNESSPSPRIIYRPEGYRVIYDEIEREIPDVSWLKYSIAASWKAADKDRLLDHSTYKDNTGDKMPTTKHYGAVVDTSTPRSITVEIGSNRISMSAPIRQLYGTLNKLGSPKWLNAAVFMAREHGKEILELNFPEKLSFNSIIFPQGSKGGNSSSAFSIANGSLSASLAKQWAAVNCLAAVGLILSARGSNQDGFSLAVPNNISLSLYRELVDKNRRRIITGGIFYPYVNYLYYLKLIITYRDKNDGNEVSTKSLRGVCGAKFVELGTQPSPAGNWFIAIPTVKYTVAEVDKIERLLYAWRKSAQPKARAAPNINRAALAQLMRGFEEGNIHSFLDGYLAYLDQISFGKNGRLELLNYPIIIKIMKAKLSYGALVETMQSETIAPLIRIIRAETYFKVFSGKGKESEHPNYQLIRHFQEVQSKSAFVNALLEVSITQSKENFASIKNKTGGEYIPAHPTENAIATLIQLAETEDPKLLAKLLLAFGMARGPKKEETENISSNND
jgi:hypothetical protein